MRWTVRRKLVLFAVAPLLATSAAVLIRDAAAERAAALRRAEQALAFHAERAASEIDARLLGVMQLAEGLATAAADRSNPRDLLRVPTLIENALERNELIASVAICGPARDAPGELVLYELSRDVPEGLRAQVPLSAAPPWYACGLIGPAWCDPEPHPRAPEAPIYRYAAPLLIAGEPVGVLALAIDPDRLVDAPDPDRPWTILSGVGPRGAEIVDASARPVRGLGPARFVPEGAPLAPDLPLVRRAGALPGRPKEPVLAAAAPIGATGWWYTTAVPLDAVLVPTHTPLLVRSAILLAGLAALAAVVALVASRLTRPVEDLAAAIDRLAAGDLEAAVPERRGRDEIARLIGGFNAMTSRLRRLLADREREAGARQALESELNVARRIQAKLLPPDRDLFPDETRFAVRGLNIPASSVGGDFFDYFTTDDARLVLAIGDVCGKGVPAALVMAVCRTAVREFARSGLPPAEIAARVNDVLLRDATDGTFVTLVVADYDPASGTLRYVNAGHPAPLHLRADGRIEGLGASCPALGVAPLEEVGGVRSSTLRLAPGDAVLMFTDGVTEARDESGTMLRDLGLRSLVQRVLEHSPDADPEQICRICVRGLLRFQRGDVADDLTLLCLRRTGARPPAGPAAPDAHPARTRDAATGTLPA